VKKRFGIHSAARLGRKLEEWVDGAVIDAEDIWTVQEKGNL
jgi:hypothetical protein